ncbi:outer membrane protein assembly factor BamE [Salinisphaera sp. Q1T1-3]|uniref:outer membrane protein assembly factor BamE n=1 Tax=Salinisphaera sp. Q1T1-3 TaxID=2321229 RepID=UPI00131416D0|nr:outer membrane protein assembly factor BamE [Salinisphaera sp. Q1T1-3]
MKPIAALVLLLSLTACSLPVFFRVPIAQGNIVTADQVQQLKLGMSKKQVAYVLGTPLIKAPFETDRWDYVFYYRNPRAHVRQSQLNLYFVDNRLNRMTGDDEYQAAIAKMGQQNGPTEDATAPGTVGTPGAPVGTQPRGAQAPTALGNASQQIPHTDTNRPQTDRTPTGGNVPADGRARPTGAGNDSSLPPLPGQPGM